MRFLVEMVNDRNPYEGSQSADCADEESSPIDLHSPTETLPCSSPLRIAPSEDTTVLNSRDKNSSVCNIVIFYARTHIMIL